MNKNLSPVATTTAPKLSLPELIAQCRAVLGSFDPAIDGLDLILQLTLQQLLTLFKANHNFDEKPALLDRYIRLVSLCQRRDKAQERQANPRPSPKQRHEPADVLLKTLAAAEELAQPSAASDDAPESETLSSATATKAETTAPVSLFPPRAALTKAQQEKLTQLEMRMHEIRQEERRRFPDNPT